MQSVARKPFEQARRTLSLTTLLLTVFLVASHVGLLWQRIENWSITEPEVMARWAVSALLGIAALYLRRMATTTRRTWLIFWLIIAVLHVVAPSPSTTPTAATLANTILAVAPLFLLLIVVAAAVGHTARSSRFAHFAPFIGFAATASIRDRAPPIR